MSIKVINVPLMPLLIGAVFGYILADSLFRAKILAGAAHTNTNISGVEVIDRGGRVVSAPIINLVFWGDAWNKGRAATLKSQVTGLVQQLIGSGYFSKLAQYRNIQPPTMGMSIVHTATPVTDTYGDDVKAVDAVMASGQIPQNPKNAFLVIPSKGRAGNATDSNGGHTLYPQKTLTPPPNMPISFLASFPSGLSTDELICAISHEIVEGMVNPMWDPGGFVANTNNYLEAPENDEISDVCEYYLQANACTNFNGLNVDRYWSNQDKRCWP